MGQQAQRVSGWPSGICLYGLVATLFSITEAGLLKVGRPLPWRTSLPALKHVRKAGVRQFLHIYHRLKDITQDELLWGDELEYGIFKVDRNRKKAWLSLRGKEVMERLAAKEDEYSDMLDGCSWHPEWGAWMIESTPNKPYTGYATDLLRVEANMRLRRKRLLTVLEPDEVSPTLTNFPLMGCGAFTIPEAEAGGPVSESKYVPDLIINPHPRFAALVANIRSRRGRKVDIRVPLFHDRNTPEFRGLHDDTEHDGGIRGALRHAGEQRPYIDMDAMAFGMGCCCMQVTFQARDIDESRYMYDQLAVLSPIMMALTAASPIFKGRLADTDVRWDTIAASVDDRTPAERGESGDDKEALEEAAVDEMAGRGVRRLYKSRYDSISTYIYECDRSGRGNSINRYNDIPCEIDEEILTQLREGGVDDTLAKHIAHLFVRDPLVIFDDSIDVDDSKTTEHFENIQSTNWQTVRWKPPPVRNSNEDPHIGWRTEFRSMEIQLTDFENAAFTVFVVLLTRIILAFDLSLYIPLSKVDENMRRAHKRDGALKEKFFFRKHLAPQQTTTAAAAAGAALASTSSEACCDHHTHAPLDGAGAGGAEASYSVCSACAGDDDYEEMTIAEILSGKGEYFPGLIPLAYMYLDYIGCDRETFSKVSSYLEYIRKRGTGETLTTAAWIRKYVTSHPDYAHDSVVSPSIAFDLVMKCKRIGEGKEQCPDLLGTVSIDPIFATEAYPATLSSDKLHISERARLFRAYKNRSPFHRKLVSHHRAPDFFHS